MKISLFILIILFSSCAVRNHAEREQYDWGYIIIQSYEVRYRFGLNDVFIMNYIDSKDIECSIPVLDTTKYLRGQKVPWPLKM